MCYSRSAGIRVAKIHASIHLSDTNVLTVPKDVSNEIAAARRARIQTKTTAEALFELLKNHSFYYRYRLDEAGRPKYLFWTYEPTTLRCADYPDVIVLDCTYKTNVHNMPLLNIVIVTSMNTVLPLAQCWLAGEKEEDFTWALATLQIFMDAHTIRRPRVFVSDRDLACLHAIDAVFPGTPRMVCRWHLERAVEAKTRQVLGQVPVEKPPPQGPKDKNSVETDAFMEAFRLAVDSKTESEFNTRRRCLRSINSELADYLDSTW